MIHMPRPGTLGRLALAGLLLLAPGCLGLDVVPYEYGSVRVTVQDGSGQPLPEVHVLLYSPQGVVDTGVTDAAGQVLFKLVPRGNFGVRAQAPAGYVAKPGTKDYADGLKVDRATDLDVHLTFVPDCCATVRAHVVDTGGAPLAGVQVILYDAVATRDVKATGADGTAVFTGLTSGGYGVRGVPPQGYAVPAGGKDFVDGIGLTIGKDTTVTLRFAHQ
jgi:hypothetical protein